MTRALLLLAALLVGCTSVTEIVIEVDTDLAIPTEVDALRVTADVFGGAPRTSVASLGAGEIAPPRTITLLYRGGPLGPVHVEAAALLSSSVRVAATRVLAFEPGRSVRVRIDLEAACVGVPCPASQTCSAGVCRAPCELTASCDDAGVPVPDTGMEADTGNRDAGPPDAGPPDANVPGDAGATCTLTDGICGVSATQALGDLVTLVPCTAPPAGVTVAWAVRLPSTLVATRADVRADTLGPSPGSASGITIPFGAYQVLPASPVTRTTKRPPTGSPNTSPAFESQNAIASKKPSLPGFLWVSDQVWPPSRLR